MFLAANTEGAHEIIEVLEKCSRALGHKVNLNKSSIHFSKGCSNVTREEVKGILNVQNESLSEKYLGMPLDVGK
jgi:hypothetical protein